MLYPNPQKKLLVLKIVFFSFAIKFFKMADEDLRAKIFAAVRAGESPDKSDVAAYTRQLQARRAQLRPKSPPRSHDSKRTDASSQKKRVHSELGAKEIKPIRFSANPSALTPVLIDNFFLNELIADVMFAMRQPHVTERRHNLLCGAPGTGKSFLVRSLAEYFGADFISAPPSIVKSPYFGMADDTIVELFTTAKSQDGKRPVFLFFDELDGIAASRTPGVENKTGIHTFLEQMDTVTEPHITVWAATNCAGDIDEAAARRFFSREIPPPAPEHRAGMISLHVPGAEDVPGLAKKMEKCTMAEIKKICQTAKNRAASDSMALMFTRQEDGMYAPDQNGNVKWSEIPVGKQANIVPTSFHWEHALLLYRSEQQTSNAFHLKQRRG